MTEEELLANLDAHKAHADELLPHNQNTILKFRHSVEVCGPGKVLFEETNNI